MPGTTRRVSVLTAWARSERTRADPPNGGDLVVDVGRLRRARTVVLRGLDLPSVCLVVVDK